MLHFFIAFTLGLASGIALTLAVIRNNKKKAADAIQKL